MKAQRAGLCVLTILMLGQGCAGTPERPGLAGGHDSLASGEGEIASGLEPAADTKKAEHVSDNLETPVGEREPAPKQQNLKVDSRQSAERQPSAEDYDWADRVLSSFNAAPSRTSVGIWGPRIVGS